MKKFTIKGPVKATIKWDEQGNTVMEFDGDVNIEVPPGEKVDLDLLNAIDGVYIEGIRVK